MNIFKLSGLSVLAVLFSFSAPVLHGASFSFTDTLLKDDDLRLFKFTLSNSGVVDLRTNSYATGGFSAVLSLFDVRDSNLLIGRDNGVDSSTGEAVLSLSLSAGQYLLAMTVFDNLAAGPRLSDGFLRAGDPFFTREFGSPGNTGSFLNIDGQPRSGRFTLLINDVTTAEAVPEPGSIMLTSLGALSLATLIYRRRLK